MKHVVIIGNGIAGITAARYIRKLSEFRITVISPESKYFFSRTALMYVYMGHMNFNDIKPYEDWFWKKNRIELIQDFVTSVDAESKKIILKNGGELKFDTLIIATGSSFNKFGWPGHDLDGVGGLVSLQDLHYMEKKSNNISRAVIVGGGLIGSEMAEMFLSRNIPVTFLVRESGYWNNILPTEESQMINRHLAEHHVELRLNTELKEILSDGHGKARAVLTNKDEEIACGWVGLTAGVKPNIQFLNGSGVNFENGILVNHFFETNVPDIYAIGDCAEFRNALPGRTKLEQVWYTGKMHGETVAHTITGNRLAYQPGPWFNSAKFFDIEYQVYGQIPSTLPNEFETLYWEHPDGRKSIRINWQKDNNEVTGFNLMGIRYRHKVCEKWIMDKRNIHFVLENLSAANCDPEFFARYEQQLINIYNGRYGTNIKLKLAKDLSDMMFIQAERGNIK